MTLNLQAYRLKLEQQLAQCRAAGVSPHPELTRRLDQLQRMAGLVDPLLPMAEPEDWEAQAALEAKAAPAGTVVLAGKVELPPAAPPRVLWEIRLQRAAARLLWAMCRSAIVIDARLRQCSRRRRCRPPRA